MSIIVTIPDSAFKAVLNHYLGQSDDADITDTQLQNLTGSINTEYTNRTIYDITGAEYLINITSFDVSFRCQLLDLKPIYGLTNLQSLNTRFSVSFSYSISVYQSLIKLEELYCDNISDLTGLEIHSNLRTLGIYSGSFNDTTLVSALTALEVLAIFGDYSNISGVSSLNNLTNINIGGNFLNDINALSELFNLRYLSIGESPVLDNISPLSKLIQLHSLSLVDTNVIDISALSSLVSLEYLDLLRNKISDVTPLATLGKLYHLDLNENPVRDITPLGNLKLLTGLLLPKTLVRDISPVKNLSLLNALVISQTQVTDFSPLATLTNLTQLNADEILSIYSETSSSATFSFANPVINTDGSLIVPLIISDNGSYENGVITWSNLPSDIQAVSFTFKHTISAGQTRSIASGIVQVKLNQQ